MYLWLAGVNFERWGGDGANRGKVTLDWTPTLQSDETLNDSDKAFVVPASTEWIVKWIWVEYISTAVAGNRQLEIRIDDAAVDMVAGVRTGLQQPASQTYYYLLAPHVAELTALRDSAVLSTIMPEWILPAGYQVRVFDRNAVDAAADDMTVQMMVLSRAV